MSVPEHLLDPDTWDECEEHGTAFLHGHRCRECRYDVEDMYAEWSIQERRNPS